MELHLEWLPPYSLRRSKGVDLFTYTFDGVDDLSAGAGIYVFGRRHGKRFAPLYVGKATDLSRRIPQQLNNNRLMNALVKAASGHRELLVGELHAKPGQQLAKVLKVLERGLIKLALAQGNDIVNKQGTKIRSHTAIMAGNRDARSWLPAHSLQFE